MNEPTIEDYQDTLVVLYMSVFSLVDALTEDFPNRPRDAVPHMASAILQATAEKAGLSAKAMTSTIVAATVRMEQDGFFSAVKRAIEEGAEP